MLPFWASIGLLSALQGLIVALPSKRAVATLHAALSRSAFSSRLWAAIPAGSIVAFVIAGIATNVSATVLTYVALIGVPVSAALALGWLAAGSRPIFALAAVPLFALAWAFQSDLAGQSAAVLLCALSCAALGALLSSATPARWLAIGIIAMAIVDATLVSVDLLQKPNAVLNAVRPAAHLPRLQSESFGSAVMGYGDFFVAGLFGGLMAMTGSQGRQRRAALITVAFALAFDLLFFALRELPATVPVALTLLAIYAFEHRSSYWCAHDRRAHDRRVSRDSLAG